MKDRPGAAAVLNDAIVSRYKGNRAAAARAAGIPNPTLLADFLGQRRHATSEQTILRLLDLVGPERSDALSAALSPTPDEALERYEDWVSDEMFWLFLGPTGREFATLAFDGVEIDAETMADVRLEAESRIERLGELFVDFLRFFSEAWRPLFECAQRLPDRRAVLACYRIVAPLLDNELSCAVARAPEELSKRTLRRCIRAAIELECVRLDLEADALGL